MFWCVLYVFFVCCVFSVFYWYVCVIDLKSGCMSFELWRITKLLGDRSIHAAGQSWMEGPSVPLSPIRLHQTSSRLFILLFCSWGHSCLTSLPKCSYNWRWAMEALHWRNHHLRYCVHIVLSEVLLYVNFNCVHFSILTVNMLASSCFIKWITQPSRHSNLKPNMSGLSLLLRKSMP